MKNIGDKLRNLAREHRMTQAQMGEKVGVSRATAAAWMNGTRAISMKHVKGLAELFQVSVGDLIDEDHVVTISDEDEANLVTSFRALHVKGRATVLELLELLQKEG